MANIYYQIIAYDQQGKKWILGSESDPKKAWQLAQNALDENPQYDAVTIRRQGASHE